MINEELFGIDAKVKKSIQAAKNISVTKAPFLVVGEKGLGKRTLTHFVHENSTRKEKTFFVVDCSLEHQEVENQILGYRDENTGRFYKGVLERGNKGTVVFAHIDGLSEAMQKRLHQIINELPDYDIDVRILATTTKNLSKLVGSGRFYRGLYNFISSNIVFLNPLRERVEDIDFLTMNFLETANKKADKKCFFGPEAMDKMRNHYWTHNIHELSSVIESAVNESEQDEITVESISIGEKKLAHVMESDDNEGIRLMSLKEAERVLIKKALIHTSENRTQAAKILGVSIRTLRNKINEYRSDGNAFFLNLR